MFGDSVLLGTVWVGTKPRNCVWVVLPHCNRDENKERGSKNLNESAHIVIFTNLLSLEEFQSTPILGHARVLHDAVLKRGAILKY